MELRSILKRFSGIELEPGRTGSASNTHHTLLQFLDMSPYSRSARGYRRFRTGVKTGVKECVSYDQSLVDTLGYKYRPEVDPHEVELSNATFLCATYIVVTTRRPY